MTSLVFFVRIQSFIVGLMETACSFDSSTFLFQSNYVYTEAAKKSQDKYRVVLDTPVYRTVQELKTHLSDVSLMFFNPSALKCFKVNLKGCLDRFKCASTAAALK